MVNHLNGDFHKLIINQAFIGQVFGLFWFKFYSNKYKN